MKLTIIAMVVKSQINPQKYGNELYAEAFDIFITRLKRSLIA